MQERKDILSTQVESSKIEEQLSAEDLEKKSNAQREVIELLFKNFDSANYLQSLKHVYRQSALLLHPDKHPDKREEYSEKFKSLSNIYESLNILTAAKFAATKTYKKAMPAKNLRKGRHFRPVKKKLVANETVNNEIAPSEADIQKAKDFIMTYEFLQAFIKCDVETQNKFKSSLPEKIQNEFNTKLDNVNSLERAKEQMATQQEIFNQSKTRLMALHPEIFKKYDSAEDKIIKDKIEKGKTGDFAISIANDPYTIKAFVKGPSGFVYTVSYLLNPDNSISALGDNKNIFPNKENVESIDKHIFEGLLAIKKDMLGMDNLLIKEKGQQPKNVGDIVIEQVDDSTHMLARLKLPDNSIKEYKYEFFQGSIKNIETGKILDNSKTPISTDFLQIQFDALQKRIQNLIDYESKKGKKDNDEFLKKKAIENLQDTLNKIKKDVKGSKINSYDEIKKLLNGPLEEVRKSSKEKHEHQLHVSLFIEFADKAKINPNSFFGQQFKRVTQSKTQKDAEKIMTEFEIAKTKETEKIDTSNTQTTSQNLKK